MDERVLEWIADNRTPWLTSFARGLMNVGTSLPVLAIGALVGLVYVVLRKRYELAIATGLAFVTASIAAAVLKATIRRPRPTASHSLVHLDGFAMPSTHAMRTAALTAAVLVTAKWLSQRSYRNLAAALIAANVVVGAAMIYLGGHWLSDVLVGWALGAALGALCAAATHRLLPSFGP